MDAAAWARLGKKNGVWGWGTEVEGGIWEMASAGGEQFLLFSKFYALLR